MCRLALLSVLFLVFISISSESLSQSVNGLRFDGEWQTKLTCPPKGSTEGYTWQFPSLIQNGSFRGERGTPGEPGYLLIEGKIAEDGKAKLSASGIVASRKYARGVFARKGRRIQLRHQSSIQGD